MWYTVHCMDHVESLRLQRAWQQLLQTTFQTSSAGENVCLLFAVIGLVGQVHTDHDWVLYSLLWEHRCSVSEIRQWTTCYHYANETCVRQCHQWRCHPPPPPSRICYDQSEIYESEILHKFWMNKRKIY